MTREQEISYDITLFARSNTIRDTRVFVELQLVNYKCEVLKEVIRGKTEIKSNIDVDFESIKMDKEEVPMNE